MQDHEAEYCNFRVITTVVATWNAGASTPGSLRRDQDNDKFFLDVIQSHKPPDILVFGFQELVDLEDKKLTASECTQHTSFVRPLTVIRDPSQRKQKE
jgi:hypothetical protein